MNEKKNYKGYTLIELLVGITVMAIVFTVGTASFREFSRRQEVTSILKTVQGDLRKAQQLALSGEKPTVDYLGNPATCIQLNGYIFRVAASADNYKISAYCTDGITTSEIIVTSKTFSQFTFSPTGSVVVFKVLGQGTNLTAVKVLTIESTSGRTGTVTIDVGGTIK